MALNASFQAHARRAMLGVHGQAHAAPARHADDVPCTNELLSMQVGEALDLDLHPRPAAEASDGATDAANGSTSGADAPPAAAAVDNGTADAPMEVTTHLPDPAPAAHARLPGHAKCGPCSQHGAVAHRHTRTIVSVSLPSTL